MGGELLGTASSAGSALTACPTLPFTFVSFYYCLTRTLSNSPSVISCAQGQGCLSRCVLVPSAMHPDEVFVEQHVVPGPWGWLALAAPGRHQLSFLQELPAVRDLQAEPWL